MEYLDYIKPLSSSDPFLQITGITRIASAVKSQPSPIFVNTVAMNMAVEFTKSSNYVRHFICQFFQQCSTEMCMIKTKVEFFRQLTSILDQNDPIAQCHMLKILGSLAPLLTDLLEVHHKILLALESPHRQVRETASSILPRLISFAPSIARHVFDKQISRHCVRKLLQVLPDDEETIKKAYAFIVQRFQKTEMMEHMSFLALRSQRLVKHVKEILIKYNEINLLKELCKHYGTNEILGEEDIARLRSRGVIFKEGSETQSISDENSIESMLKKENLKENEYKEIYKNWDKNCDFEWISNRLEKLIIEKSKELDFCCRLAKLLRLPQIYIENLLKLEIAVPQATLEFAFMVIRANWLDPLNEIIHKLDTWQQYLVACELMSEGLHAKALELFVKLKTEFKGSNEKIYEWLCTLKIISEYESRKDRVVDGFAALSHLGCLDLGHKIYFQSEFLLCRLLLVQYLKSLQSSQDISVVISEFVNIRSRLNNLLFLFFKLPKSTTQCIKKWRDIVGMLYLILNSLKEGKDYQFRLKRYYPKSCFLMECAGNSIEEVINFVLNIPMNYPKQFFQFNNPISISLDMNQDGMIKINRGKEFLIEASAKVTELSHKPPLLQFNVNGSQIEKDPEFSFSYTKKATAAGVCNITIPIVPTNIGIYIVKIHATILDSKLRHIGKSEYGEIILECI